MNGSRSVAVALLALAILAGIAPDGFAHGPLAVRQSGASPHVANAPPVAPPVTSPVYPPVWLPGTIPGRTPSWLPGTVPGYPPTWLPAMPRDNNIGNQPPNGVLSIPPPEVGNTFPRGILQPGDLSAEEQKSLDLVCGSPLVHGVAAYNQCVVGQINLMQAAGRRPNLDTLSPSERSSVEQVCMEAKRQGPALYNHCLAVHGPSMHR
jgi:hypothetical protein